MAVQQHSTRTPARPLLPLAGAFETDRSLPETHSGFVSKRIDIETVGATRVTVARQSDDALLAILDAGPISPDDLAFMSQQRRKRAQASIDVLIDLLDAIDPDPDLEPTMAGGNGMGQLDECEPEGDEEVSLGAPEVEFSEFTGRIVRQGHIDQRHWADGLPAVVGWDVDREQDVADDEPVLGAPEQSSTYAHGYSQLLDQSFWARGGDVDEREDVSEDEGACIQSRCHDEEADEPSLGSPEAHHDQRRWGQGKGSREGDHDGTGELGQRRREQRDVLELTRRETMATLRGLRRDTPTHPPASVIPVLSPRGFPYLGVAL